MEDAVVFAGAAGVVFSVPETPARLPIPTETSTLLLVGDEDLGQGDVLDARGSHRSASTYVWQDNAGQQQNGNEGTTTHRHA